MIHKAELEQLESIKKILVEGEEVELMVVQRRLGPGGALIYPKIVVATNKRIIIETRRMMGTHTDYDVITYRAVRNVKLEHGLVSSTVLIASEFHGSTKDGAGEGYGGVIMGLRYNDAIKLVEFINMKVSEVAGGAAESEALKEEARLQMQKGRQLHCKMCGVSNNMYANYCSNCGARL